MNNPKLPPEIQYALFQQHLTAQMKLAMERTLESAKELTRELRKQNQLLEERKALQEDEELEF